MTGRRFPATLAAVLTAGFLLRVLYVLLQPAGDPSFATPLLDGAYYLEWARGILSGGGGPGGAYYLAPLYPVLLAGFLAVAGESFTALYCLQHLLAVVAAGLLAPAVRGKVGGAAALTASALFLLYHPLLFFSSRPLSEIPALALLSAALFALSGDKVRGAGLAGALGGLAVLAKPNLLPVLGLWFLMELGSKRYRRAVALAACTVLVLLPATVRNLSVSGHLVPVSSNSGITFYHGNGPGAEGIYTPPEGFSGSLASQREEATALASAIAGERLDAVDADGWWRAEALRVRMAQPADTALLVGKRIAFTAGNREIGLDYAPSLDRNPLRWAAPVPFAVLLGFAVAGVTMRGFRRSGGAAVWLAILASVLTPVLFYFSSRYRLPLAAFLAVPAAAGVVSFRSAGNRPITGRRKILALVAGSAVAAASFFVPTGGLESSADAASISNRAVSWMKAGDLEKAARDLEEALRIDPASTGALYNLGVVREAGGEHEEAEDAYRRVLALDPGHAEAAGNLARRLVERGRPAEAIPILRRALASRPGHRVCWTNLVVVLTMTGDLDGAREAARQAAAHEAALDPELLRTIGIDREGKIETDEERTP